VLGCMPWSPSKWPPPKVRPAVLLRELVLYLFLVLIEADRFIPTKPAIEMVSPLLLACSSGHRTVLRELGSELLDEI